LQLGDQSGNISHNSESILEKQIKPDILVHHCLISLKRTVGALPDVSSHGSVGWRILIVSIIIVGIGKKVKEETKTPST
jgi:hypothetical protein